MQVPNISLGAIAFKCLNRYCYFAIDNTENEVRISVLNIDKQNIYHIL